MYTLLVLVPPGSFLAITLLTPVVLAVFVNVNNAAIVELDFAALITVLLLAVLLTYCVIPVKDETVLPAAPPEPPVE